MVCSFRLTMSTNRRLSLLFSQKGASPKPQLRLRYGSVISYFLMSAMIAVVWFPLCNAMYRAQSLEMWYFVYSHLMLFQHHHAPHHTDLLESVGTFGQCSRRCLPNFSLVFLHICRPKSTMLVTEFYSRIESARQI